MRVCERATAIFAPGAAVKGVANVNGGGLGRKTVVCRGCYNKVRMLYFIHQHASRPNSFVSCVLVCTERNRISRQTRGCVSCDGHSSLLLCCHRSRSRKTDWFHASPRCGRRGARPARTDPSRRPSARFMFEIRGCSHESRSRREQKRLYRYVSREAFWLLGHDPVAAVVISRRASPAFATRSFSRSDI